MPTTVNKIKSVAVVYGSVPASFGTLLALGDTYTYNHAIIMSTLDTDIVIKFGDNEINFPANKDIVFDNFPHNGTLTYKYSSAPSSGSLKVICF